MTTSLGDALVLGSLWNLNDYSDIQGSAAPLATLARCNTYRFTHPRPCHLNFRRYGMGADRAVYGADASIFDYSFHRTILTSSDALVLARVVPDS